MKKFLAIVFCLSMILSLLAGCGGSSSSAAPSTSTPASSGAPAEKPADWPKKDITIVCPFKAGGGMDLSTRLTAKYLEKYLGVTVTVSNVEGGNSWTGWTQVIKGPKDGYLLGYANYPAQVAGYLNPSAGITFTYKDFTNVSNVVHDSNILVVSQKHSKFNTLQEFMDYAKANPVVLSTGGGAGSDDDVLIAKINRAFGTQIESGRNASTAEGKAAMLGGHVEGAIANVSEYYSLIGSTGDDAIRILAVWSDERSDFIPDVPTAAEAGYPDVYGSSDRGLIAPPGLDPAVKQILIDTLKKIDQDPEFQADAQTQGMGIKMIMGDDFDAFIDDIEKTMTELKPALGWS